MSTEEKIMCPHCKESFEDSKESLTGLSKEVQKCPHCGFLIDYDWVRTARELTKIGLEIGIARRHMLNKMLPRRRFKPLPLKVGATPENGVEPSESDEDLKFENIPLSKRVPTGRRRVNPKKRGAVNGRKR